MKTIIDLVGSLSGAEIGLVLVLLVVLCVAGPVFAIGWLVKLLRSYGRLLDARTKEYTHMLTEQMHTCERDLKESRQRYHDAMQGLTTKSLEAQAVLSNAMNKNTQAFVDVSKTLGDCAHELKLAREEREDRWRGKG